MTQNKTDTEENYQQDQTLVKSERKKKLEQFT